MTICKSLAIATLALASFAANAGDVEYNSYFLGDNVTDTIPGEARSVLDFGNFVDHTSAGTSRIAGDSFVDNFFFNILDAQYVSFVAQALPSLFSSGSQVSFTGFTLTAAGDPSDVYTLSNLAVGDGIISTNAKSTWLDSGVYDFTITGTINQNGGLYLGAVGMTPASGIGVTAAVPEPSALALMLSGLLVLSVIGWIKRTK